MEYRKVCLYCGAPVKTDRYRCTCQDEDTWTHEYRTVGLNLELEEADKQKARDSFRRYHFKSPKGILQYDLLPFLPTHRLPLPPVGLTGLHQLKKMGRRYQADLYIKNEGDNPSGCFKDRETMMCLLNTLKKGKRKVVIYSSGNAAASAAFFARRMNFQLTTFVAGDTYPEKVDYIRRQGSDVVVIGDEHTTFEEGFRLFAEMSYRGVFSQGGYDNWSVRNPYRVQGDKTTALEIVKQLRRSTEEPDALPDFVVVPTGNGSCLAGIWKGFQELKQIGVIDRCPRMVSVGIQNANPVYKAVRQHETDHPLVCDLDQLDPAMEQIGSTIVAEEGYDSVEATKSVLNSGGTAIVVNRGQLEQTATQFLQSERQLALTKGILPEPASFIALSAVDQLEAQGRLSQGQRVVAVITGHGLKARSIIQRILQPRKDLQGLVQKIIAQKQTRGKTPPRKKGQKVSVSANFSDLKTAFFQLQNSHAHL